MENEEKTTHKFNSMAWVYDLMQHFRIRPKVHKADVGAHKKIPGQRLAPFQYANVLDLACGTGAAIPFLDSSNAYTGLDLSSAMLGQAQKKARRKCFAVASFF